LINMWLHYTDEMCLLGRFQESSWTLSDGKISLEVVMEQTVNLEIRTYTV